MLGCASPSAALEILAAARFFVILLHLCFSINHITNQHGICRAPLYIRQYSTIFDIFCVPNFGGISQSTAEILLLPVSKNKRPPCWNFTSGSDFYVCVTIGMSLCMCVPNFIQIGPSATELWRHIYFSRWRSGHRNSTSGFGFRDFAYLRRWKSTCVPNFGGISQSTAEILLLPVSKNKHPPFWNSTSGFYRASICESGLGSRNSVRLSVCHTRAL